MAVKLPAMRVTVSVGQPQNLAVSDNHRIKWTEFVEWFKQPLVTPEKFSNFINASFKKKQALKGSAGWYIRCEIKGRTRNRKAVRPSQLITFDLDSVPAEMVDSILRGKELKGISFVVHSTRSHTPEDPRLRMVIPLRDDLPAEDYNRVSRIIALLIDPNLEHVDPVSFRPAQMMFKPSVSKDMLKHYIYYVQGGQPLDWQTEVADWEQFNGDSYDFSNLPKAASEATLRESAEEAEDPLTKKGPVGDFCRAWSITELIVGREDENGNKVEGPLADKYQVDDWDNGVAVRCTYLHGHSTNGAVVYEDKFMFSHHGSDDASDQLLNAYDLVRIHKFGDLDEKIDEDTSMKDRPSVKAMKEWMLTDVGFRTQQTESRYGALDMLDDEDEGGWDEPEDEGGGDEEDDDLDADDLLGVPYADIRKNASSVVERRRKIAPKPNKGWRRDLDLDQDGKVKTTDPNCVSILTNDKRFWRRIAFNELKQEPVLLGDIKPRHPILQPWPCKDEVYGDRWQDGMTNLISATLQLPSGEGNVGYGVRFSDSTVNKAIDLCSYHNRFHPIKDYWDVIRQESDEVDEEMTLRVLIDICGAPDTPYVREAFKMMLIASIERIERPGCKFDYAIILEGAQGTGKSTFIKVLYGAEFFCELAGDLSNAQRVAEEIMGKHVGELPELSALHKSDVNDLKGFMTKTGDDVRLAYGRKVTELPRQCVFWGTTNDSEYLRDPTGNRRFWPVPLDGRQIDIERLYAIKDTIWRTGLMWHAEMRAAAGPHAELDFSLKGVALDEAVETQQSRRKTEQWEEWLAQILDWADEPTTIQEIMHEIGGTAYEADALAEDAHDPDTLALRMGFTREMARLHGIGSKSVVSQTSTEALLWNKVEEALAQNGWFQVDGGKRDSHGRKMNKVKFAGTSRRYWLREGITESEKKEGYRVVVEDDPPEDDDLI